MKKLSCLNQERNIDRSSSVYKQKQFKSVVNKYVSGFFYVRGNREWAFSLEEMSLWIMDFWILARSDGLK